MSRPRVRDGEASTVERVFGRVGELNGDHDGFLRAEMPSETASMNNCSDISGAPLHTDTVCPRGGCSLCGRLSHDASCSGSLPWTMHTQHRDLFPLSFPASQPSSALRRGGKHIDPRPHLCGCSSLQMLMGPEVIVGRLIVRQSPLTVTMLAAGGTTLAGRILATKDDTPIPGARVKVGTLSAITDASGNFLLTAVPTGPQVLLIDGPSALYPADLPVPVTITPTVANTLSYPVYLHEVSQEYFPLIPGQATVIQPPDISDFSMIIPAGTTIMGWDNQPNTRVSVTRVPIDRRSGVRHDY